jgi:lysophospholipase L1-like esterase
MEKFLYVSVQGIPGAYLRDMVAMCRQGLYDVSSFTAVIIMSGTNDFSCGYTQQQMFSMYTAAVQHIRAINPSAQIAIGGILPRPCDATDPKTFHRIKLRIQFNTALLLHCQVLGVAYFKTEKALKGKGSDSYLFHTDLLHLSDHGIVFLQKWLEGRIACLIGAAPQNTN